MTDRFDGCYNCAKRKGVECLKDPANPVRIVGDGPCEDHELMTSFQYARACEEAYREHEKAKRGMIHGGAVGSK